MDNNGFKVGDIVLHNPRTEMKPGRPRYIGLVVEINSFNLYRTWWFWGDKSQLSDADDSGSSFLKIGHISDITSDNPEVEVIW